MLKPKVEELLQTKGVTLDGELMQKTTPPEISEEVIFDENYALAHLLTAGQVFLNNHWWYAEKHMREDEKHKAWPEAACKTFSINVNCSDVFCWASADAEEVEYHELESLYEHYQKDPMWGTAVWCIKKRNEMPQKPVYNDIMKGGIWDLDSMGLQENSVETYHREKKGKLNCNTF